MEVWGVIFFLNYLMQIPNGWKTLYKKGMLEINIHI